MGSRRARFVVGLVAVATLLAFAGAAAGKTNDASFSDALIVATTQTPDSTLLQVNSTDNGVMANVEIDVPSAYTLDLGQAIGTKIADVLVITRTLSLAQGALTVADPAKYTDAASLACDSQPHVAVWQMGIGNVGATIVVPWFVDAGAAGGYALHVCLPASQFGAQGTPLATMMLSFDGPPLHAPTTPGAYLWHALVTPFGSDGSTPDASGLVEYQANVPLPVTLTMRSTYNAHTKAATVSGKLMIAGAPANGWTMDVGLSAKANGLPNQIGTASTGADGTFNYPIFLTKSVYVTVDPEPTAHTCTSTVAAACFVTELPLAEAQTHVIVPKKKAKRRKK